METDGRRGSRPSRRALLASIAAGASVAIAGCSDLTASGDDPRVDQRSSPQLDDEPYAQLYREVVDSVSLVTATQAELPGQGSGFVYDEGHVVTNQHVVAGADEVEVQYPTGDWETVEVAGEDVYSDLAVLAVESRPEPATPLSLAEEEPVVGQQVMAIGNPFGFEGSASVGIVSGVNRVLASPTGFSIPNAVQTDAALNPGNSGGPLVSLDGDVVGVVSAGGGDNVGFAISAALTARVVPSLIETGEFGHSFVGVRLLDVSPPVARANDLDEARGVLVVDVLPDGPADGVLRGSDDEVPIDGESVPVGGDVIVEIEGQEIPGEQALSTYLALETDPGDTIAVTVLREGEPTTVDLTLGERPDPGEQLG